MPDPTHPLLAALWSDLHGPPDLLDAVQITGPQVVLPSVFDVTSFATACAGVAALAVAELAAVRAGGPVPRVRVDRRGAAASFRFEALARPVGWELPPIWDPVAGDYAVADGWIRLHTNYRAHLAAVCAVLGVPAERAAVAAAVRGWSADALEAAVVAAGGCAAVMRSEADWRAHPAGVASAGERAARLVERGPVRFAGLEGEVEAPLAGVRVLDLTRVIAGPVATRYLAAYGADVLRVDPPGFEEVGALLPEVTLGKRCAALDLRSAAGREAWWALVAQAHVLVVGLRPGALAGLGLELEALRRVQPALIVVEHDAYGWSGPWAGRRGFDSLVQMSTGIAAAGAVAAGVERPTPLPAQALDHGIGHLLAAGACRALSRLLREGVGSHVRGSLVGAANVLRSLRAGDGAAVGLGEVERAPVETAWGPLEQVPLAGEVLGWAPRWLVPGGPLGRHRAVFGG